MTQRETVAVPRPEAEPADRAPAQVFSAHVVMLWTLARPGEKDARHPKYRVLRDDR